MDDLAKLLRQSGLSDADSRRHLSDPEYIYEGMTTLREALRAIVPQNLVGKVPPAQVAKAFTILRSGHTMDNVRTSAPRDTRDALEALAGALEEIAGEFDSGVLALYRVIQADAATMHGYAEPGHVGVFWSYDSNLTQSGNVTMECVVPPGSIDWASTLVLLADGVEREVRLIQGAPISRFSIGMDDADFDWDAPISPNQIA